MKRFFFLRHGLTLGGSHSSCLKKCFTSFHVGGAFTKFCMFVATVDGSEIPNKHLLDGAKTL